MATVAAASSKRGAGLGVGERGAEGSAEGSAEEECSRTTNDELYTALKPALGPLNAGVLGEWEPPTLAVPQCQLPSKSKPHAARTQPESQKMHLAALSVNVQRPNPFTSPPANQRASPPSVALGVPATTVLPPAAASLFRPEVPCCVHPDADLITPIQIMAGRLSCLPRIVFRPSPLRLA
ncbi:hypothetical protein P154DRAFT_577476 [Amniculicola lignicola CBS 123094]|uniref:Uncharacterized protein n=1 Tax=Amniculicola lignicola CBS 123094 TaxID=1392246 RepID=A0A6A5WMJ8_9PLEO|nr:hypothetical protein P154DRAFT_577476 [Amniculicola lignicola CBS 123094]